MSPSYDSKKTQSKISNRAAGGTSPSSKSPPHWGHSGCASSLQPRAGTTHVNCPPEMLVRDATATVFNGGWSHIHPHHHHLTCPKIPTLRKNADIQPKSYCLHSSVTVSQLRSANDGNLSEIQIPKTSHRVKRDF